MPFTFSRERSCPVCGAKFTEAELRPEYDPVVVVVCPACGKELWRPGFDEDAELVVHDPDTDAGGI
jgi:hypothetical protein